MKRGIASLSHLTSQQYEYMMYVRNFSLLACQKHNGNSRVQLCPTPFWFLCGVGGGGGRGGGVRGAKVSDRRDFLV